MVKEISKRTGLIAWRDHTRMELFATLKKCLALDEKTIEKAVFDRVPKFCLNNIDRFYSTLDNTEMS